MKSLIKSIFISATLIIFSAPVYTYAQAQTLKIELAEGEEIDSILTKANSKTVTVVLKSGNEITGKVYKVTEELLHLTELSGKDFYDAVIRIDDIQAVVVKAR